MIEIDYNVYKVSINGKPLKTKSIKSKVHNLISSHTTYGNYHFDSNNNVMCVNDFFKLKKKIGSEIRYEVNITGSIIKVSPAQRTVNQYSNNKEYIVLVLESPSRNEYKFFHSPNGPALGRTGDMIDRYLSNVLKNSINNHRIPNGNYLVYIINSVPLQTDLSSLFNDRKLTKTIKIHIWFELFLNQHYSNRFKRIISFIKPKLILNAATSYRISRNKKSIQEEVSDSLKGLGFPVLTGKHPSKWNNQTSFY